MHSGSADYPSFDLEMPSLSLSNRLISMEDVNNMLIDLFYLKGKDEIDIELLDTLQMFAGIYRDSAGVFCKSAGKIL